MTAVSFIKKVDGQQVSMMCVLIFYIMAVDNTLRPAAQLLKRCNLIRNTSAMWHLYHGRRKGFKDWTDANNRKCLSLTLVSVTKGILRVPRSFQSQTLGIQWGIVGLFFSLALPLSEGSKMRIVFRSDNPCQFCRTRSSNLHPSPFSQRPPFSTHQRFERSSGKRGIQNNKCFTSYD